MWLLAVAVLIADVVFGELIVMEPENMKIFRQAVLDAHNYYRSQHVDTPPLILDESLSTTTQNAVVKQCNHPSLRFNTMGGEHTTPAEGEQTYSENLSGGQTWGNYQSDANIIENWAGQMVHDWWKEIRYYHWGETCGSSCHFTQIVWQPTDRLGVGYCAWQDENQYYNKVHIRLTPAGNKLDAKNPGKWSMVQRLKPGLDIDMVPILKYDKNGKVLGDPPNYRKTAAPTRPEPITSSTACGPAKSPINGEVIVCTGTEIGRWCAVGCDSGYNLKESSLRLYKSHTRLNLMQCLTNGTWEYPGRCVKERVVDCGVPVPPQSGTIRHYTGTTQGSWATVGCPKGFISFRWNKTDENWHLYRWNPVQCLETGSWEDVGSCVT